MGSPDLVFDEAAFGTSALTHDLTCERACPRGQEIRAERARTRVERFAGAAGLVSAGESAACGMPYQSRRRQANGPGEIIGVAPPYAAGLAAMAAGFLLCRAVIVRKSGASGDVRRGNGDAESTRLIGLEGGVRGGDDVGGDDATVTTTTSVQAVDSAAFPARGAWK